MIFRRYIFIWITIFIHFSSTINIDFPNRNVMLAPYSTWQVVIKAPYVPQSRMNVYYYPNFPNSMELSELGKDVGEFSINVWPTNSGIANYTTKIMRSPSIKSFALCFSFKSEKDFQNSCISFGTIDSLKCTTDNNLYTAGDIVTVKCRLTFSGLYQPKITFSKFINNVTTETKNNLMITTLVFPASENATLIKAYAQITKVLTTNVTYTELFKKEYTYSDISDILDNHPDSNFTLTQELSIAYQEKAQIDLQLYKNIYFVGEVIQFKVSGIPSPTLTLKDLITNQVVKTSDNNLLITKDYLSPSNRTFEVTACNYLQIKGSRQQFCKVVDLFITVFPVTTTPATTTMASIHNSTLSTTPSRSPTADNNNQNGIGNKKGLIIGIVVGCVLFLFIIIGVILWKRNLSKEMGEKEKVEMNFNQNEQIETQIDSQYSPKKQFSIEDVTGANAHLHTIDDVPRSRRPLKVFEPINTTDTL